MCNSLNPFVDFLIFKNSFLELYTFITLHACAVMVGWKMKITKPKPTPQYTSHSDYILSLLSEITNEPKPNWTKWWHATAVFTKPLAASHLLAFGTATVEDCSPALSSAMLNMAIYV